MTTPHQAAAGVAATGDVAYDFNASINDVIETLANGVHGYTAAAKQLDDVDTQHTFHELAASRRNVTEQVVRAATDEGLDVDGDVDGTAVGAMHRAWIAVEGTIAGDSSVIESAGQLHGRLLLVHGTGDDNVHVDHSMRMIDALQRAGKDFEVMLYPDARHGIETPHQLYDLRRRMTAFVLEHL